MHIISTVEDWSLVNDPAIRIFCIRPGDYRASGEIRLTTSGTELSPRVLRYYAPSGDKPTHPVRATSEERAIVQKLAFSAVQYWIVDRLSVLNNDANNALENRTLKISDNASHIVVQDSLVEGGRVGVWINDSNDNVLQRSVVRNTIHTPDDDNCINLEGRPYSTVRNNRIVSNEVYDCTDSLQLVTLEDSAGNLTFPGTRVANNDFYLTPAMYTDCQGHMDPDGACSIAEGRFDIKGGGTSSTEAGLVHITRNRIWGARRTDPVSSGGSSWGDGIDVCCGRDIHYLLIENNLVFDNDVGITVEGVGSSRITVRDNVLYNIHARSTGDGHGLTALSGTHHNEWYRNTVIDTVLWGQFDGAQDDVRCNIAVQVDWGRVSLSSTAGQNHYYGHTTVPTVNDNSSVAYASIDAAHAQDLCFERKRLTGPEQYCIPYALPTVLSPHWQACPVTTGAIASVGIDDQLIPSE